MGRLENVRKIEHTRILLFFFSFDVSVTRTPPRLTGLPYPSDRATRLGGSPHLSR